MSAQEKRLIKRLLQKFSKPTEIGQDLPKYKLIRIRWAYTKSGEIILPFVYVGVNNAFDLLSGKTFKVDIMSERESFARFLNMPMSDIEIKSTVQILSQFVPQTGVFEDLYCDILWQDWLKHHLIEDFARSKMVNKHEIEPLINLLRKELSKQSKKKKSSIVQ